MHKYKMETDSIDKSQKKPNNLRVIVDHKLSVNQQCDVVEKVSNLILVHNNSSVICKT